MSIAHLGVNLPNSRKLRPRHLAACLATALGLGSLVTPAIAANIVVEVCSDANVFVPPNPPVPPLILFGLRESVAIANSGDTIDMTHLVGCTITLTDGEIPITVNNLTFNGPPGQPVTINGNYTSRIFDHTGTGTVTLSYLSLTNGYSGPVDSYTGTGYGGCIFSKGSLSLGHSTVSACEAGYGSAIFAANNISLNRSVVTGNTATGNTTYNPGTVEMNGNLYAKYGQINNNFGSGITSFGNVELIDTTINGNSRGGGVFARGYVALTASTIDSNIGRGITSGGVVTVNGSTISNNTSSFSGGGISVYVGKYTTTSGLTITNSTISGNSAHGQSTKGGGIYVYYSVPMTPIKISNSTIAYNSAQYKGGGIYAKNCSGFTLQSSIIADNSVTSSNEQSYSDADVTSCTVTGSNNLVGVLSFSLPGTLTGPAGLTPLANNGGTVKTHALLATSPAIDEGNNLLNLATDERGLPRVVGPAADIGAYERQTNDDEIFYNGFE